MEGFVVILGDDVNTDLLHPPAYFATDSEIAARGAFAGLPGGAAALGPPPWLLIAGENFGCGSSRESTLRALKHAGVIGVAAVSVSHIFRRNAVNAGIPVVLLKEAAHGLISRARARLDLNAGLLVSDGQKLCIEPPDAYETQILAAGGLAPLLEAENWTWGERA